MNEKTVVVVFPSLFTLNKLKFLISSITKLTRIKKQKIKKIRKEDSILVIEAEDPVITSSTIHSLFGIEKIAIAIEIENDFNVIVSGISKIGTNLLLRGERFYVQVEGRGTTHLPKDIELAATSALVEKTTHLETKPGTKLNHDKLIYAHLTKLHAYICIFMDNGYGGIPIKSQNEQVFCCIYDELSAISCLQTIKIGFEPRILVCYNSEPELLGIVKMLIQILPRLGQTKVELDFCKIDLKSKSIMLKTCAITQLLVMLAKKTKINRISLAISPLVFPIKFIENNIKFVFRQGLIPWLPLSGIENSIFENAIEIGLEKHLEKIKNLVKQKFVSIDFPNNKLDRISCTALMTRKTITVTVGQKNIHEIIDLLKSNH